MSCDPQSNCTLPAVPQSAPHSRSMVSAQLARSLALVGMVVHMGTGRRKARQSVHAQVAMLHTSNAERPALQMWRVAATRVWPEKVMASHKCTMHMPCYNMLRMCSEATPCGTVRCMCCGTRVPSVLQAHGRMPCGLKDTCACDAQLLLFCACLRCVQRRRCRDGTVRVLCNAAWCECVCARTVLCVPVMFNAFRRSLHPAHKPAPCTCR